jgi:hypothetical protein
MNSQTPRAKGDVEVQKKQRLDKNNCARLAADAGDSPRQA